MNEDQVRLNSGIDGFALPREVRVVEERSGSVSLPLIDTAGSAKALVWPGVGAHLRSMQRISLQASGRTIPLRHPMEAVYYVISGAVEVEDLDSNSRHQVHSGGMVLVDPGTRYRIAAGLDGSELVGGPCPADPQLYDSLGTS